MTKLQSYTDKNIVSRAEFARLNGWQRGRVTQLANEGRLVCDDTGKVFIIESIKQQGFGATEIAKKMGIGRSTVYKLLKEISEL